MIFIRSMFCVKQAVEK